MKIDFAVCVSPLKVLIRIRPANGHFQDRML